MGERTGLGQLETAVLRTMAGLSGLSSRYVRCSDVLDALEAEGFGAAYLYPVIQDMTAWWRLHLPLLDGQGNFGSPGNDPAAEAAYTEVRLSPVGRLALASETGQAGPLPLALIEGTVYRGGRVPPFEPRLVLDTLRHLLAQPAQPFTDAELDLLVGPPTLPTGGIIEGDLPTLLRGERVEMRSSCRIDRVERDGRQVLEITGLPLGVSADQILVSIAERVHQPGPNNEDVHSYVADIQDHTSGREHTIRQWVILRPNVDPRDAEEWLRTIWPVSIDTTWQLPAPSSSRLRATAETIANQVSGIRQLQALL